MLNYDSIFRRFWQANSVKIFNIVFFRVFMQFCCYFIAKLLVKKSIFC